MDLNQDIICDTNIWYGIAQGRIRRPVAKLCHTRTVLHEILQAKPADCQRICYAIISQETAGFHLHPVAHIADLLGFVLPEEYVSESIKQDKQKRSIIQLLASRSLAAEERDELDKMTCTFQEPIRHFWQALCGVVKDYKNIGGKMEQDAHLIETKAHIINWIKAKYPESVETDVINWERIELFLNTFNKWLIELAISARKPKFNDLVDAFNLAYVQPGTFYWTQDRDWRTLISSVGLQRYLYNPD